MAQSKKPEKNIIDAMSLNQIRAQQIKTENEAMLSWEEKWGFLKAQTKEKKSSEVEETPYSLGVPSKFKYLLKDESVKLSSKQDISVESIKSTESMRAFYMFSHQTKKLQQSLGAPCDKFNFPATSNNQIGWWVENATRRLEEDRLHSDASSRNTLLDSYLRNKKI